MDQPARAVPLVRAAGIHDSVLVHVPFIESDDRGAADEPGPVGDAPGAEELGRAAGLPGADLVMEDVLREPLAPTARVVNRGRQAFLHPARTLSVLPEPERTARGVVGPRGLARALTGTVVPGRGDELAPLVVLIRIGLVIARVPLMALELPIGPVRQARAPLFPRTTPVPARSVDPRQTALLVV